MCFFCDCRYVRAYTGFIPGMQPLSYLHTKEKAQHSTAQHRTSPVAAARAAVATGAWVKSKHDMYLIRVSVGA